MSVQESIAFDISPALAAIAQLEQRHLAYLNAAKQRQQATARGYATGYRNAVRSTTQAQDRAARRWARAAKRAGREVEREIKQVQRQAEKGFISSEQADREIVALTGRLERFSQRARRLTGQVSREVNRATASALRSVADTAAGADRQTEVTFRRIRETVRRVTRDTAREVRRVGMDLARGLIDGDEAQRRLAAIEGRYERFQRRIRAIGEEAGLTGRALRTELSQGLQRVKRDMADTERRATGLIAQLREQNSLSGKISRSLGRGLQAAKLFIAFEAAQLLSRGLRAVTRDAAAFDNALVDVGARTGLTGSDLEALGDRIRSMSNTLGIGAVELLSYAETAGQLGIQGADNIAAFVEAAAKLERVSDLSADEAATSLAKIAAAFREPVSNAIRLGSVANDLGNNLNATSGDILEASRRTGRAGLNFGLTFDQVAALNGVLVETGLEARVAGTSLRNVFGILVEKAGEAADVLGITEAQFRAMIDEDAMGALQAYLAGLGEMPDQLRAIHILDVFGRENRLAVETLATSQERLNEVLGMSARAYEEGTSLTREFDATLASLTRQFEIFRARLGGRVTGALLAFVPAAEAVLSVLNRWLANTQALGEELGRLGQEMADLDETERLTRRYDVLAAKTNRTEEETADLKRITEELARRYPDLVRATNAAGQATDIYTGKVRLAAEAERALKRATEERIMARLGDEFARGVAMRDEGERIRAATDRGERAGFTLADMGAGLAGRNSRALTGAQRERIANERDLAQVAEQNRLLERGQQLIEDNALALANYYDAANPPDANALAKKLRITVEEATELHGRLKALADEAAVVATPTGGTSGDGGDEDGGDDELTLEEREAMRARAQARLRAIQDLEAEARAVEIEAMERSAAQVAAQVNHEFDERLRQVRRRYHDLGQAVPEAVENALGEGGAARVQALKAAFGIDEASVEAVTDDLDRLLAETADTLDARMGDFVEGLNEEREVDFGETTLGEYAAQLRLGMLAAIDDVDAALADLQERFGAATTEAQREEIGALIRQLQALRGEYERGADTSQSWAERAAQADESVRASIEQGVEELATGIASVAGSIASKADGFDTFADAVDSTLQVLLSTAASMLEQLGRIAIATAVSIEGIRNALSSMNPAVAFAAGVAAIALAAVIRSQVASIGDRQQRRAERREEASETPDAPEGRRFARGGLVEGRNVQALLNDDPADARPEYVVNARSTARYRPAIEAINEGRSPEAVARRLGVPLAAIAPDRAAEASVRERMAGMAARARAAMPTGSMDAAGAAERASQQAEQRRADLSAALREVAGMNEATASRLAGRLERAVASQRLRATVRGSELRYLLESTERDDEGAF